MAPRSVEYVFKGNFSNLTAGLAAAGRSVGDLGEKLQTVDSSGKRVGTSATRTATEMRANWSKVGGTLTVVGGSMTALTAKTLQTGIAYNTLQQTSRAALTTLLGSANAANRQMDKLDAFARTSPFAKQVFISAQQQMIGFGMAAEKVLPTLDAIQNAVAAFGGSNEDIASIAESIAKVQSNGKITAVTLMELGRKGLDAAALIGSQMGKTGQEIRDQITAGTLDAGQALDALAAGMAERFADAAANMKNTLPGAIDRVKAALRDLSAAFAAPLVGPEGGGLLVGATNQVADFLRMIERAPGPVKLVSGALFALTGVVTTVGGGFLLLAPRIAATRDAIRLLAADSPRAAAGMSMLGKTAKGIGALAAAVAALKAAHQLLEKSDPAASAGAFRRAFEDMATGADAGGASLDKLARNENTNWAWATFAKEKIFGLDDAFNALNQGGMRRFVQKPHYLFGVFTDRAGLAEASIGRIDEALTELVQTGNLDAAQQGFAHLSEKAAAAGMSTDKLRSYLPQYTEAMAEVRHATKGSADAQAELASRVEQALDAMQKQREEAIRSANAELGYAAAVLDAEDAVKENGKTLDTSTRNGIANRKALLSLADAWNSQSDAAKNSKGAHRDAVATFVSVATQMGMNERAARDYAKELLEIPPKRHTKIELETAEAETALSRFRSMLTGIPASKAVNYKVNAPMRPPLVVGPPLAKADGGFVSGPGGPRDDLIPARLSNGEFVVQASAVARYGLPFFEALNAERFASGGKVGKNKGAASKAVIVGTNFGADLNLVQYLKQQERALKASTEAMDKERKARDDIVSSMDRLSSGVSSKLMGGLFDTAGSNPWLSQGARSASVVGSVFGSLGMSVANADAWMAAQKTLVGKGMSADVFAAIAEQARGPQDLAALAGLSAADISRMNSLYSTATAKTTAAGAFAGQAAYGAELSAQTAVLQQHTAQNAALSKDVKALTKTVDELGKKVAKAITGSIPKGKK